MWILRLTLSLVALYVAAVYAKSYLLLDDVRVFVGKHFLYQIGDEQFLSIYRVYRVVERGQKSLPDWLRYVNKTSQLIGSPKSGDEGLYTIRVRAECIDPMKLRCSDRISRTFLIKVVEPLTAAESRGRKKLSPVHAGRVIKHKRPRVKMTREFANQHKYTNTILPTRTVLHDPSTTAAISSASYFLHDNNKNITSDSNISTNQSLVFDLTFPSICSKSEVSFFASLILHVVHALNTSEAKELKSRLALFISKDSSLVFLTDSSSILDSIQYTTRKHILTAGPGNVIESLSDSIELGWHLECGGSIDKIVNFAKALQHNVDVGRITEELGYDIIAWFIFSDKPVSRRQKRDAHNKGRQTGTPSFTPSLPTTNTDFQRSSTLFIEPSLSIASTSVELISTSSVYTSDSTHFSSNILSDSSMDISTSSFLQPSFSSILSSSHSSTIMSYSTLIKASPKIDSKSISHSFPSFSDSISQMSSKIFTTTDSLVLLSFVSQYVSSFISSSSFVSSYYFSSSLSLQNSSIEFSESSSSNVFPSVSSSLSSFSSFDKSSYVIVSSTEQSLSDSTLFTSPYSFDSISTLSLFLPSSSILTVSLKSTSFINVIESPFSSFLTVNESDSKIGPTFALSITPFLSSSATISLKDLQSELSSSLSSSDLRYSETTINVITSSSQLTTSLSSSLLNSTLIYPSFSMVSTYLPSMTSFSTIQLSFRNATSFCILTPFTLMTYWPTRSFVHISLRSSVSDSFSSLFIVPSHTVFISSFKLNTGDSFITYGKSSPSEIIFTSLTTDFSDLLTDSSFESLTPTQFSSSIFSTTVSSYLPVPFTNLFSQSEVPSSFSTFITSTQNVYMSSIISSGLSSMPNSSSMQFISLSSDLSGFLSPSSTVLSFYSTTTSSMMFFTTFTSNTSTTRLSSPIFSLQTSLSQNISERTQSLSTSSFLSEPPMTVPSRNVILSSIVSLETPFISLETPFTSLETSFTSLETPFTSLETSSNSISLLSFTHSLSKFIAPTLTDDLSMLYSSSQFKTTLKQYESVESSSAYSTSDFETMTLDLNTLKSDFITLISSYTTLKSYFDTTVLVPSLDISSTISLDSSSMSVAPSTVVLSSPSVVLLSTTQIFSSSISTTAAPDAQPVLQFAIDHLEVYVGRYFELKIPEKTFNDTEDGSTSNLNLSISLVYGKPLYPDSWLQFNATTQILYGLPLMRDLESGQNKHVLEKFILTASDSKGQIAKDVISIAYRYDKEVTHDITIKFDGDYSKFENDRNALVDVAQKMAMFYGDSDLQHFTIFDVVNGSVILNWGNNSLFGSKCLREEIHEMYEKLVLENGTVSDNFTSRFSGMGISPVFTSLELKRVCLLPLTTAPPSKPPLKTVEDEQKFWLTIGIPALVVIVVIIIIALLLLICCRHRRSNKDVPHSEKPSYLEDRRPIIFPEELEMVDPSLKPKNPLILPSDYLVETPPAVPPHSRSRPPDYQIPVFEDEIFEVDDTAGPPPPGIAETATDPPPYRLPPPYYNPHRAK